MKIGILITARLKSSRLPMKALKNIMGKPMIVHMIDRLKLSRKAKLIVMNTSTNPQDDALVEIAKKEGIYYFRGHEDDVLFRTYEAASYYKIDLVINCTADNPFVDPVYIDKLVKYHLLENNDFTNIEGLPFGVFSYAVNREAIKKALEIKDEIDTEAWGGYFKDTGKFEIGTLVVDNSFFRRPNLRLTVDYEEDFRLVTKIFEGLYNGRRVFSLKEILEYLDKYPELEKINIKVRQKEPLPIKLKKYV